MQAGLDCRNCTEGRLERLDDPTDQTFLQRQRGCHGPALAPCALDGEDLDRCPRRLVRWPEVVPILEVWPHLRAGRYPLAGGYADQPALFIDLLAVVDAFVQDQRATTSTFERSNVRTL